MRTVNIHAAKTHLSSLLEEVQKGEEIIIAKAGKPVARLVPFEPTNGRRLRACCAARSGRRPMPGTLIRSSRGYSTRAIRAFRALLDERWRPATLAAKAGEE